MRKGRFSRLVCTLIIAAAAQIPCAAQEPATIDPDLLLGYLGMHAATGKAAAQDPSLLHAASGMIGVTEAEYSAMTEIARVAVSDLGVASSEARAAHQEAERRGQSTRDVSDRFNARRATIMARATAELRSRLSSRSWNSFAAFINGKFRENTTILSVPAK